MGISLQLNITMRGLAGLILFLAFNSFQCQTFTEGNCRYSCDADGSCTTTWEGPPRSGGTQASCFSPDFGGSCFGSVDGCRDCNKACGISISSGGSNNRPSGGSSSGSRPSRPSSISGGSNSGCSYDCDGWPYKQCEMSTRWGSATCINPFARRGSTTIYSNYPNCANVPSGCERCDDVCSKRDGKQDKLDYRSGGSNSGSSGAWDDNIGGLYRCEVNGTCRCEIHNGEKVCIAK